MGDNESKVADTPQYQSTPTPGQKKTYHVEFYSSSDELLNKFVFRFEVDKVGDLRKLIKERMVAKQAIAEDLEIVVKTSDGYEVDDADNINEVLPDGMVKVYQKVDRSAYSSVGSSFSSRSDSSRRSHHRKHRSSRSEASRSQASSSQVSQSERSVESVQVLPASIETFFKKEIKSSQQMEIKPNRQIKVESRMEQKAESFMNPEVKVLKFFCPQIRDAIFEIPFQNGINSYWQLSRHILKYLKKDGSMKALLYSKLGQPLLYNLDQMKYALPELNLEDEFWVVLTPTKATIDTAPDAPQISSNLVTLKIEGKQNFDVKADLSNTLKTLKYKIYERTNIHPDNQILTCDKFQKEYLTSDEKKLSEYEIVADSTVKVKFKQTGNYVPANFSDKFYYKDIQLTREQSQSSLNTLRTHFMALAAHLTEDDKLKVVTFIRGYTKNTPLAHALRVMFSGTFLSQSHRIALEEGMLLAVEKYLKSVVPELRDLKNNNLFEQVRNFWGFMLQGIKKMDQMEVINKQQECLILKRICALTLQPILKPRIVRLDDGQRVVVDEASFEKQVAEGASYSVLTDPKKAKLDSSKDLEAAYNQYKSNLLQDQDIRTLYWIGYKRRHPEIMLPPRGPVDSNKLSIDMYPNLKIFNPLELKMKSEVYLLVKNKKNELRIYNGINKDPSKPYKIFDVISGKQKDMNIDLLAANVQSENVEEVIDPKKMKPRITREPKEAIVVLFDVSYSMKSQFFSESHLQRIGAAKAFFEAFAYRTIAYNFEHVVSLMFFNNKITEYCGFTEAIYDFNRLVSDADPGYSTALHDGIIKAVQSLVEFRKKFPDCILRILVLSDGEDTCSDASRSTALDAVLKHKIIMDSFAHGQDCVGMKVVSKASGGKCFLMKNFEESLKLFEQQTVLCYRARKPYFKYTHNSFAQRALRAEGEPFDLSANVPEFNYPSFSKTESAQDTLKNLCFPRLAKQVSNSMALKRIAKQIEAYDNHPNPLVAVYPCSDDISLWKMLLVGPKTTPYADGVYLLYASFPSDYPQKAPEFRFLTPIYHCNVSSSGHICHSIFTRDYDPQLSVRQLIDAVYGMVLSPEYQDPLENTIAMLFQSDHEKYIANARESTNKHASKSIEQIAASLFEGAGDSEKKQKEEELTKWIVKAKMNN